MNYIVDAAERAGITVSIISPSWLTKSMSFAVSQKIDIGKRSIAVWGPSLTFKGKYLLVLTKIISYFWLIYWLIFNTKHTDYVLVYHTPKLSLAIRIVKKIIRCKIILEVEEIYSKVWGLNRKQIIMENKLISAADSYIVSSYQLKKELGEKVKFVLHGDYRFKRLIKHKDKDYIKIIYAGEIEKVKNGAFYSVHAAEYFPRNYKLLIAGYGTNENINSLKNKIDEINLKRGEETCIFYGLLKEYELSNLLSFCDVALNPQRLGKYMDTAFPSKILIYLTHGVNVISSRIKSVEESDISDMITFIDDTDPKTIIKSILAVEHVSKNYQEKLNVLDCSFVKFLENIFYDN